MESQFDFFKKAFLAGRIPHGIIICGNEFVDKKRIAIELAKFISCSSQEFSKKPCEVCENCRKIEKGVYQDFFSTEPGESGEIHISQIRDIIWRLSLKANSDNFKIAVINKAHAMNQEAQNCLLKVLEEPKGKAIIILTTEYPETLLPTVLSRVQKIRFFLEKKNEFAGGEKAISDFQKLLRSDISFRFNYAKNLSEKDKEKIPAVLNDWIYYLRRILREKINNEDLKEAAGFEKYNSKKIAKIISDIQSAAFLLSTTNISNRLALENLLLEI